MLPLHGGTQTTTRRDSPEMNVYLITIDDSDALVIVSRNQHEAAREAAVLAGVRPGSASVSVKLLGAAEPNVQEGPLLRGTVP